MDFTISKNTDKSFPDAVEAVKAELQKEGFGIITEVDLKEKFREKLNIEFRNYLILGACNPALAHKAIQFEDRIGVMLPCNVLVQERDNSEVEVSAVNPLASIGVTGNADLQRLAGEVSEKLKQALERV